MQKIPMQEVNASIYSRRIGRGPSRAKSSKISTGFLLSSCIWVIVCILFLAILIPPTTVEGLIIRGLLTVFPIVMLWVFFTAGSGNTGALVTLLIFILITTELSFRNRALSDTSIDAQNLFKAAIWGSGLLVALLNWRTLKNGLKQPSGYLMAALAIWFVVSATYSPIKLFSFGAAISFLSVVLFGIVVRQLIPEKLLLRAIIAVMGIMLFASLVLYLIAPDRVMAQMEGGSILRLAGLFGTPNSLGRIAALIVLLCVVAIRVDAIKIHSPLILAVGFSAIACLILSQSRTAAVALICAAAIVLLIERPLMLMVLATTASLALMIFLLSDIRIEDMALIFSRTGYVSEVTTMTGRTEIWSFFWNEIQKEPVLGYGYGSSKYLMPLLYRTFWGWTTTHAHNMWIQTLFSAGAIGFALLLAVFVTQLTYCHRSKDIASLAILSFVFIIGLAEANAVNGAPSVLTIFWSLWLVAKRPDSMTNSNALFHQPPTAEQSALSQRRAI